MREKKLKRKKTRKILLIVLVFISLLLIWSRFISTKGLTVKEYAISSNRIPLKMHGIKIIQFSDLHYGSTINRQELKKIVNKINSYKPTFVFFTGDLLEKGISFTDDEINYLINELNRINAQFKYGVYGNHDEDEAIKVLEKTNIKILNNEFEEVYYLDNSPILIAGFPSAILDEHDYSILEEQNNDYFKIILMHEPDMIDNILEYNPDLVLSGHSHGGQVRLPIIGAIYKPYLSRKYYEDYYQLDNTKLFVSSGLGTSRIKFRLFNKPSINLYRLYNEN